MEYLTKDYVLKLCEQRKDLIYELTSLNENLPNYSVKVSIIENQIGKIDSEASNYFYMLKDIEMMNSTNKHNVEMQKLNSNGTN